MGAVIIFFCVSCRKLSIPVGGLSREAGNCIWCRSTCRDRSLAYATRKYSKGFTKKTPLQVFGVSDGANFEKRAQKYFGGKYLNFHFHKEPKLDITCVPLELKSKADFVVCSEVLEHVVPPINLAFKGLFELLKPGGTALISVPHTSIGNAHVEHFEVLRDAELILEPYPVWQGVAQNGELIKYKNLIFHGGIGATLEFRVFSEESLMEHLIEVGFIKIVSIPNMRRYGIKWEPWSRVWIARKPN